MYELNVYSPSSGGGGGSGGAGGAASSGGSGGTSGGAGSNGSGGTGGAGGTVTALSRSGWTATASATNENPANALDGNAGSRWSTSAAQVNGQYFQVDMQTAQTFRQLTLDAAGNNGDYPRGYQVFVSNDGSNWGTAVAAGSPTT